MAHLIKLKQKTGTKFVIRYRLDGKYYKLPLPIGTSEQEANLKKKEIEVKLDQHKLGLRTFDLSFQSGPMLISSFREWFLAHKKTAKRKGTQIAPRTIETYERAFNFLAGCLGNMPISKIKNRLPEIEDALAPYAATTRSILIRSLRQAWSFGNERDKVKDNPFKKMDILKQSDEPEPEILTANEMDRIGAKISNDHIYLGYCLARYAALRRSEIVRNITWDDLDFDAEELKIPYGKIKDNRRVPIIPKLKQILENFIKEYKGKHGKEPEGYIIDLNLESLTQGLSRAKKEAGIKKKGSVHIYRHSLATAALEQDADIREVQLFLGHSKISTTQKYTHLTNKHIKKKFSKMKF